MKLKTLVRTAILAAALPVVAATSASANDADHGDKDHQDALKAQAAISRADAEKLALAKVEGGTVKEAELEEEDGRLVWSIDIRSPGTKDVTEVLVDAKAGKIVSIETESSEAEKKEANGEEEHEDEDKD